MPDHLLFIPDEIHAQLARLHCGDVDLALRRAVAHYIKHKRPKRMPAVTLPPITERDIAVVEVLKAGTPTADVAVRFGISVGTVARLRVKHIGIKSAEYIIKRNDEMHEDFANGYSIAEVSNRFGVTPATAHRIKYHYKPTDRT
jgi:hypothetical protein